MHLKKMLIFTSTKINIVKIMHQASIPDTLALIFTVSTLFEKKCQFYNVIKVRKRAKIRNTIKYHT